MRSLTVFPRLLRVASVLMAWRLDEIVETAHLFRPLKLVRPFFGTPRPDVDTLSRGARLRGAMTELGPIFVKAGQVLSTRRDLIPADIADELALLQDQVPPFPGAEARAIVERELKQPVTTLFARFDETALASASIAQVHAATLRDGREVVVKVLRPGIAKRIANDVALLRSVVVVKYVVDAHGNMIKSELIRSNRDGETEATALASLKSSAPFPKPAPHLLRGGKIEISETWLFNNDGRFQLRTIAQPQIDS